MTRPCDGRNVNVCVAEGCHGEVCLKDNTTDEVIHVAHSVDNYPLCWPMEAEGEFKASRKDTEVTCPECLKIIKEFDEEMLGKENDG